MKTLLCCLVFVCTACAGDPLQPTPVPEGCEPMPWCEAFDNDAVRDSLLTLPTDTV